MESMFYNIFKKSNNKPSFFFLPQDHCTVYNRQKIHWFIGDGKWRAGETYRPRLWHAWGAYYDEAGKCYPYVMYAVYDSTSRMLSEITVLPKRPGQEYYFNQNVFDILTK